MATVATTVAGAALIAGVLREVFKTLFHPSGKAGATMAVFALVWRATGRLGGRGMAGPLSMVTVIALWVVVLAVGWALVYWPALPGSFIFASGLDSSEQDGFLDALYFAWVTQSTLGFGDIAPDEPVLRALVPVQATIGFGLFTLVVTWVLSVYPALHRQRAAASLVHAIAGAHERTGGGAHPATLARQMERVASGLHGVRVDLVQYPSTFYFDVPRHTLSLAAALPLVAELTRRGDPGDETGAAAAELAAATDLLATTLAEEHLDLAGADTDRVIAAYRRHHETPGS